LKKRTSINSIPKIHKEKEMADFRKWILAFAALVLVLGLAAPASAQLSCTSSLTVVPSLRHEGFTELTGDILLSCTSSKTPAPSTPTGTPIPTANFTVSLSAPVTSRILGGALPQALTDAILLVDDPAPGVQNVCTTPLNPAEACVDLGTTPPGSPLNTPGEYNVFQGYLGATTPGPNTVTFLGVPVDPPTTTVTYRITNIRIDATTLALGSGTGGTTPVYAYISASPSSSVNIQNPQVVVGLVGWGLTTSTASAGASLFQCQAFTGTLGTITFTENFATAFKTQGASGTTYPQNLPGFPYNTESGLEIALSDGESGYADTPTELEATITNIPAGATISVQSYAVSTASVTCAAGAVGCVPVLSDANLISPAAGTPGVNTQVVVADNSTGTAPIPSVTVVWQITDTNPAAIDSLAFTVTGTLVPPSGTLTPTTLTGPVNITTGFWPQATAASTTEAIPTFSSTVELNSTPTSLFTIAQCETILLFPYITDFYGFDTGLAISNTSLDSLPTGQTAVGQTGTCSVTFFGNGGIATTLGTSGVYSSTSDTVLTTGLIPPGQTWAFALSGIDPGYNSTPTYGTTGYAIATCNFQYAHGYSFVSDTGIRNFAAAYLALIIPDATRTATPFTCSAGTTACALTGEQLVH
jgi:hypothetical protein